MLLALPARANTEITILHTSDIHGHIYNWDYTANAPADLGLAVIATLVAREREDDPELLLFDGGDVLQGTPLAWYYVVQRPSDPNPVALTLNTIGYTAMTLGNHEFNFGQAVLKKFVSELKFPVICANIVGIDDKPVYTPYLVKTVKGIKVAVIGLITPGVPSWEKPQNIQGLTFVDAVETARRILPEVKKQRPSVIVGLCHSGLHMRPSNPDKKDAWLTDYRTWEPSERSEASYRDFVIKLAEAFPEFTVILSGHSHVRIPMCFINGVLVVQPESRARGVCKVRLVVSDGGKVEDRRAEYLSCTRIPPDPKILELTKQHHEATMSFLDTPLGIAVGRFPGGHIARRKDGPLADLINTAQLAMAAEAGHPAQISLTAIFSETAQLKPGPITMRDVYAIYPYENTLAVLEISGDVLRRALEHNALFWDRFDPENPPRSSRDLVARNARGYDWDLYSGIDYAIDVSKPPGMRVAFLRLNGKDVAPDQRLTIALNNYRLAGGGGFTMFKEGKMVWESAISIRDYLAEFITARRKLDPQEFFVQNWRLLPENLPE
ncbi:MAG: 5'-nucleotidase C-terminal domain-containing protein [Kiritimatiellae bacterium]|nr:5'-nucleotidase C-terminal domain-containing protein [Kiritimatiellia bacterium]